MLATVLLGFVFAHTAPAFVRPWCKTASDCNFLLV